jgi:putative hydrolase of HD superfamily
MSMNGPLAQQMEFLIEVEKLKIIYRQNMVIDATRSENSAEHSWHLALMAVVLFEHAADPQVDLMKVIQMLLLHDIVEIDAGDTFLYDSTGNIDRAGRETRAADRIFGLLPEGQRLRFTALWKEFEERETPSALFAASLDNMQPVVNHYCTKGAAIKKHHLKTSQVIEKKKFIESASPALWDYTLETIHKSEAEGFYSPEK